MIIGRDHELEQLGGLVGALGSGARVLLIEGEAGIGKTTIWEAGLAAATAAPARVLSAQAAQAEDVAAGERCCPRSRPNCNECDPPCRAGESCRDGFCLEV